MKKSSFAIALLALVLAACGKKEADQAGTTEAATSTEVAAETAPAPAPAAPPPTEAAADAPITTADLDVYAKGMAREIEVLAGHVAALKQAREAKDQAAEAAALVALGSDAAAREGANVAGVEPARYETIKAQIDDVLATLDMAKAMQPQIAAAEQADTSQFTEEQKQQMAANLAEMKAAFEAPYEKLPADVRDAFKSREAELAKLRADALAARLSGLSG